MMLAACYLGRSLQHPLRDRPAALCLGLLLGLCLQAVAGMAQSPGRYNDVLGPGSLAPDWPPLESTDGRQLSLDDFPEARVIVLVFTCNSCPYAIDYEPRLIELSHQISRDSTEVAVIAINPNQIPADSLEKMRERATQKQFSFPYLKDPQQQVAKAYGAARTPEFFVLGPLENGQRRVVYLGAFDNHTDPQQVTEQYVAEAVAAALGGEPASIQETPPVGCRIRSAPRGRGPDSGAPPEGD